MKDQKKLYFTEEQYRYARDECGALEYALGRGYALTRKGNYYQMKEHDSMVFTQDGRWFWNSHALKGRAIEFIMAYEEKTLPEAVQILNHVEGQTFADAARGDVQPRSLPAPCPPTPIEKAAFKLPAQSDDFRRLFGYLCGTRKLDREILRELIHQGGLYESVYRYTVPDTGELKEVHNAVFVGRDEHGEPKNAFQRGLSSLGESTAYKRDVPGSDPSAVFCLPGNKDAETVVVFEAAIDAISHACVFKDAGLDYKFCDRIALGGTEKAIGLSTYLQAHPHVTRVVIAMDEDAAGRAADAKLRELLAEREYEVASLRQSVGKDWNDYLLKWRQISETVARLPTDSALQEGLVVGRIHYLDSTGSVSATVAYGDRAALERQARLCLNGGQRIVVETPEQQARIRQDREARAPAQTQSVPEPENEMEC